MLSTLPSQGEELAAAFLGALMGGLGDLVSSGFDLSTFWKIANLEAEELKKRITFFTGVVKVAQSSLHEASLSKKIETMRKGRADPIANSAEWHNALYELFCHPFVQSLKKSLGSSKRTILIAFDECTNLDASAPVPRAYASKEEMSLIALQRIMKAFDAAKDIDLWFLLLDTNSSAVDLAPSKKLATSHRLRGGLSFLTPWVFLDFHQHVRKSPPDIKTAGDALKFTHLKKYGRPVKHTVWFFLALTDGHLVLGHPEREGSRGNSEGQTLFHDNGH